VKPQTVEAVLYRPADVPEPPGAANFTAQALAEVQGWYTDRLGASFSIVPPVSFAAGQAWEEIAAAARGPGYAPGTACGFNIWRAAVADIASRAFNICDDSRTRFLLYFRPPLPAGDETPVGLGGTVGVENFGCRYARPGMFCMSDQMTRLLCGETTEALRAAGWDVPWFASTERAPRGAIAHELVHCWTELPHSETGHTITNSWWDWPEVGFLREEERILVTSGALVRA